MKKLLSAAIVAVLIVAFVFGVVAQSKPVVGVSCTLACNRTTYKLVECCTYTFENGNVVTQCKKIGWCYPE